MAEDATTQHENGQQTDENNGNGHGGGEDQRVPYSRFEEVNKRATGRPRRNSRTSATGCSSSRTATRARSTVSGQRGSAPSRSSPN
jgi:hypothetical protein